MRRIAVSLGLLLLLAPVPQLLGQSAAPPAPDDRFKADLLLFVAHPDDDTLAGTYLAKILEDGKRVAVVYGTPGDSGGNQNGPERASSLGAIRQIEARRGLATLGITNVWFLSGHDTAGQDPVRSLANWGHGRVLAEAVRLVRLTRPEVILTWMPMQVAGENHGDHQASSVLAIEAFDLAGDPAAFPEQVAAPTEQFEWLLEGLRPWQPKKIYFMSDAMDTRFMEGHGPSYPVTALSKKGEKYWEYAYRQLQAHVTQYREELEQLAKADQATREKMVTGAQPGDALLDPLRLIRGKSHVRSAVTADVFDGITDAPLSGGVAGSSGPDGSLTGVSIGLGGPWHFYHRFWKAHSVAELAAIDLHEIGPLGGGSSVRVPIVVINHDSTPKQVTVSTRLPAGWRELDRPATVTVPARGELEFTSRLVGPASATGGTVDAVYESAGAAPVTVRLVMQPGSNPLPQD
jgi:LmbE family N-acetylglucosaminyl deacetylase